jgi:hypothetical protein
MTSTAVTTGVPKRAYPNGSQFQCGPRGTGPRERGGVIIANFFHRVCAASLAMLPPIRGFALKPSLYRSWGRHSCRALLDLHAFPVSLASVPDPAMSIKSLARWAESRGAFWPVYRSPASWPLGQLVGPPCSCFVPAFNAQVADCAIFMARVLEWAGKDRHSVDGPATGTGILTAIAGSHAGIGALRGHIGEYAVLWRKRHKNLAWRCTSSASKKPRR